MNDQEVMIALQECAMGLINGGADPATVKGCAAKLASDIGEDIIRGAFAPSEPEPSLAPGEPAPAIAEGSRGAETAEAEDDDAA